MSVLSYQSLSDDEIFKLCTKQCGIITSTEDKQYYTLCCLFCTEKFLYFDGFIAHMQEHVSPLNNEGVFGNSDSNNSNNISNYYDAAVNGNANGVAAAAADSCSNDTEDLTDATNDACLLPEQLVSIKQEVFDPAQHMQNDYEPFITGMLEHSNNIGVHNNYNYFNSYKVKEETPDEDVMDFVDTSYISEQYMQYDDYAAESNPTAQQQQSDHQQQLQQQQQSLLAENDNSYNKEDLYINDASYINADDEDADEESNYDNLVEESLLGNPSASKTGPLLHIKDRKQIQFLIDSYRTNRFLWDHHHPQFRDRVKRQNFLDWIIREYKRRFKMNLAKDAITRKWDNLRTVYKRECNRMSLEKTNVSTLWYFKELHFLNGLYGGKTQTQLTVEPVVNEHLYRRRLATLWNDASTIKLLSMLKNYPCFYVRSDPDYRSKERRGEYLQQMALALQQIMDVSPIQISKRISQLRFEYSKQKQERMSCEKRNKLFIPSFTHYEQMFFMDNDIAPFVCDYCGIVLETQREMEMHEVTQHGGSGNHQITANDDDDGVIPYACTICSATFVDVDVYTRHQQSHMKKDTRYNCDLCTASFREKHNYQAHMRRHNDELFLPALISAPPSEGKNYNASTRAAAAGGAEQQRPERRFVCDYPHCGKAFSARQSLHEHLKVQHLDDEYKCDICGKGFKSSKNLQNHKQIHDAVKRYICKICGSAFAQAAGLYLHKRRHTKQSERSRINKIY